MLQMYANGARQKVAKDYFTENRNATLCKQL